MMTAAQVGIMRQVKSIKEGRRDRYGAAMGNGWQLHIEGAMGECAVAKVLGIYWSGSVNNFDGPDVGMLEVRTTDGHANRLILHDRDNDDAIFVLVTGVNGVYEVRGYISGRDGKLPEYLDDPIGGRQAYFVPQDKLKSL
jgi:hypothetical protein